MDAFVHLHRLSYETSNPTVLFSRRRVNNGYHDNHTSVARYHNKPTKDRETHGRRIDFIENSLQERKEENPVGRSRLYQRPGTCRPNPDCIFSCCWIGARQRLRAKASTWLLSIYLFFSTWSLSFLFCFYCCCCFLSTEITV